MIYSGLQHDFGIRPAVRFGSAVGQISDRRVCDIYNSVSERNRCVRQLCRHRSRDKERKLVIRDFGEVMRCILFQMKRDVG